MKKRTTRQQYLTDSKNLRKMEVGKHGLFPFICPKDLQEAFLEDPHLNNYPDESFEGVTRRFAWTDLSDREIINAVKHHLIYSTLDVQPEFAENVDWSQTAIETACKSNSEMADDELRNSWGMIDQVIAYLKARGDCGIVVDRLELERNAMACRMFDRNMT